MLVSKNEIEAYIKALGVDLVGFSPIIDNSEYLNRIEKKKDMNKLYPRHIQASEYVNVDKYVVNAKTIISIGVSYHQRSIYHPNKLYAHYSKISYGKDYHHIVYNYLNNIVEYLKSYKSDLNSYICCDTKDLDDRYFAYICGHGFYGKNSMLINKQLGSEVVYGTIICDLDLGLLPNKLIESGCNDCDLCEKACPSKSLDNYYLDYKSCISHLSQTKEMIDYQKMARSIYGCDICNVVCPYNSNAKISTHFSEEVGYVNLLDLINMSRREYYTFFNKRSLTWLNFNIIKKNGILLLKREVENNNNEVIDNLNSLKKKSESDLIKNTINFIMKRG